MRIYAKNILTKFRPDQIWNDAALNFFEKSLKRSPQQQEQEQAEYWVATWDQFLIFKNKS